jgi:predicted DNA-binding transcriptional regulator AlpA
MTTENSKVSTKADGWEPRPADKHRIATVSRRLFSIDETSDVTGRSRATIWRLIANGTLQVVRIGARTSVTSESLERLVREGALMRGRRRRPSPRRADAKGEARTTNEG